MEGTKAGAHSGENVDMWRETPLIRSPQLSEKLKSDVYIKLESLQHGQSFKFRGISHFVKEAINTHGSSVHLIVASGGNAGLATATAANAFNVHCTVYLPSTASTHALKFFRTEGADVQVHGNIYDDALAAAKAAAASDPKGVLVPAFDHPTVWEGHSSMIEEISRQLPRDVKPDAIVCSVGGGGLAGGVIIGCKSVGWEDVPLITMETSGSNCFYQTLALNEGLFTSKRDPPDHVSSSYNTEHGVVLAHLSKLTSLALCLGATSPSPAVVKMALTRKGGVKSVHIPDEIAIQAALQFADDHKQVVELACSTALAPAYYPPLFDRLVPARQDGQPRTVVFIACGGFAVSLASMMEYSPLLVAWLQREATWDAWCNGERWAIPKSRLAD